ncbi:MAG: hypothetical protein OXK79_09545 [Chloroflexota bacterium]|nr:hypothetical protein [Chloroflexota bacterium]
MPSLATPRRRERIASELERERDAAKRDTAGCEVEYEELKELYLRGVRSTSERSDGSVGLHVPSPCWPFLDESDGNYIIQDEDGDVSDRA